MNIDKDKLNKLAYYSEYAGEPVVTLKDALSCEIKPVDCDDCSNEDDECYLCLHQSRISHFKLKPKKKIIDLSMMVGSDIDMEVSYTNDFSRAEIIKYNIHTAQNANFRIRQDHWHSWQGGDSPLPEGLDIRLLSRNGDDTKASNSKYINFRWEHGFIDDIIAFKVIGTADNARYEWQEE